MVLQGQLVGAAALVDPSDALVNVENGFSAVEFGNQLLGLLQLRHCGFQVVPVDAQHGAVNIDAGLLLGFGEVAFFCCFGCRRRVKVSWKAA